MSAMRFVTRYLFG